MKGEQSLAWKTALRRLGVLAVKGSLCLAFGLWVAGDISAQIRPVPLERRYSAEVERNFQKAVQFYQQRQYRKAIFSLETLLEAFPENHRETASLYLMGRAHYKQGNFVKAREVLRRLIHNFPGSQYVDDARYLFAAMAYHEGDYLRSFEQLLWLAENSSDPRLKARADTLAYQLIREKFPYERIVQLQTSFRDQKAQEILILAAAEKAADLGYIQELETLVESFRRQFSKSRFAGLIDRLRRVVEREEKGLRIGVILPMTGPYSEEAKALWNGMQFALENFLDSFPEQQIRLALRDSQGKAARAVLAAQELVKDKRVIALVGELMSPQTAAIAAVASYHHVPLLAPTATEVGIATIGKEIFQLNSDLEVRGQALAYFAIRQLGMRTFALLAPADDYGHSVAQGFVRTAEQLGGQVLAQMWYYEGDTNFKKVFSTIREIGLKQAFRDSLRIFNPNITEAEVDSLWEIRSRWRFSSSYRTGSDKLTDSTATPVTAFDAIVLPIYTEDIPYVAPHLALYNIRAQILGGSYWNNLEILEENRQYVDGAIFISDFYVDEADYRYRSFRDRFRQRFGKTPGKMEIFGYDTMQFLLRAIQEGARNRKGIREKLENIIPFRGLRGPIEFQEKPRVNVGLNFLKFEDNSIRKIY